MTLALTGTLVQRRTLFKRSLIKASDALDTVNLDIPLFIRILEVAREDLKSDEELHKLVSKILELSKTKDSLSMADYDEIKTALPESATEETEDDMTTASTLKAFSRLREIARTSELSNNPFGAQMIKVHREFQKNNLPVGTPQRIGNKVCLFELEQEYTPQMFKGAMSDMGMREGDDGSWCRADLPVCITLKHPDMIQVKVTGV